MCMKIIFMNWFNEAVKRKQANQMPATLSNYDTIYLCPKEPFVIEDKSKTSKTTKMDIDQKEKSLPSEPFHPGITDPEKALSKNQIWKLKQKEEKTTV